MIDKYEEIFDRYKRFIEENSEYNARVVKYNTNTSPYFPLVTCELSNNTDTENCTNDKIEKYEALYFTINIYTKDQKHNNSIVSYNVVNNELLKLTYMFFDNLNCLRTLTRPTPNIDKSIFRHTVQYQCMIGNIRGNIIRR